MITSARFKLAGDAHRAAGDWDALAGYVGAGEQQDQAGEEVAEGLLGGDAHHDTGDRTTHQQGGEG